MAMKTLKGFTFFEVILYLGIFSLMAVMLFDFSWNMLDMGTKERSARQTFSEARMTVERIRYEIRRASGIDAGASVFDDDDGKLVLERLGSSDTVTIEIENGVVTLTETGQSAVALHSAETVASALRFTEYGSATDKSEYAQFTLTLEAFLAGSPDWPRDTRTELRSGAHIRHSGI